MFAKLIAIAELMRWHKPIGTTLLLFPTLAALVLASDGLPPLDLLIVFSLGCLLMRSAGCVVNDIFDRKIDALVDRTKNRPLASGRLSVNTAWILFCTLTAISASLLAFLNPPTRWLAVAGIGIAIVYPLSKRFTYFPQAVLGVAFSWGILMASTAVTGTITQGIWFLFVASFFWIFAYDTIYAMMDLDDDRQIGVKSAAVKVGKNVRNLIAAMYGLAALTLLLLGYFSDLNLLYIGAIAALICLFGYFVSQLNDSSPAHLQKLFNANQWGWLLVLIGVSVG